MTIADRCLGHVEGTAREDIYTARSDGTHLAQVTNTPDFEDLADWGSHPLAT
jgi:hypothetical protein